ncbi:MAG: NAD(P)/FAD-dependent oxidoreductase [Chitinophagaceae bacterium]
MASISFWEKDTFYAKQDVIIVGAGLMGLWTAFEVKQKKPNYKITILEKHSTPIGASTRNAGFACFGSATELLADVRLLGENAMLQTVEMRYKGIQKIRNTFTDEQIGYEHCGGFECLQTTNQPDDIEAVVAHLNTLLQAITKQTNTFTIANNQLQQMQLKGFETLIANHLEGGLHSGKLVQSLTQKVQSIGVQILYGIEVADWVKQSNNIELHSKQGITFYTNQLVFCTNAYTHLYFPELQTEPARGQILVTEPIDNLPMKGTFHFDEGFYYWRNVGNRILLGGGRNVAFEEERTTSFDCTSKIQNHLENFLHKHLVSKNVSIDYRWSGLMGFTNHKQPLVTEVATSVFVAIACNGMGVALTPIMAEKLTAMLA